MPRSAARRHRDTKGPATAGPFRCSGLATSLTPANCGVRRLSGASTDTSVQVKFNLSNDRRMRRVRGFARRTCASISRLRVERPKNPSGPSRPSLAGGLRASLMKFDCISAAAKVGLGASAGGLRAGSARFRRASGRSAGHEGQLAGIRETESAGRRRRFRERAGGGACRREATRRRVRGHRAA